MKRFVLFWGGNMEAEVVSGTSISDAFSRAGYGGGAIAALDYYAEERKDEESLSEASLVDAHRR